MITSVKEWNGFRCGPLVFDSSTTVLVEDRFRRSTSTLRKHTACFNVIHDAVPNQRQIVRSRDRVAHWRNEFKVYWLEICWINGQFIRAMVRGPRILATGRASGWDTRGVEYEAFDELPTELQVAVKEYEKEHVT